MGAIARWAQPAAAQAMAAAAAHDEAGERTLGQAVTRGHGAVRGHGLGAARFKAGMLAARRRASKAGIGRHFPHFSPHQRAGEGLQ